MFANRADAGRRLALRMRHLRPPDLVVVGLPRGGVPVAAEVAEALDAPLDVIVVRKLGVPSQPELAMGALGEDGVRVINDEVVRLARLTTAEVEAVERRESSELDRRVRLLRAVHPRVPLEGRVVALIDDGIATGATARAACLVARAAGARRIVLAVPVAPADWVERFEGVADELIALETPTRFTGVGQAYRDFSQMSDEDVLRCLRRHRWDSGAKPTATPTSSPGDEH